MPFAHEQDGRRSALGSSHDLQAPSGQALFRCRSVLVDDFDLDRQRRSRFTRHQPRVSAASRSHRHLIHIGRFASSVHESVHELLSTHA